MADESTVLGVRMTPHQERVYRLAAERLAALHAAMCDRDTTAGGDREWARNMIHAALREPDDPRPVPFAEGSAASVAQRLDAEGRVTPDRPAKKPDAISVLAAALEDAVGVVWDLETEAVYLIGALHKAGFKVVES